MPAIEALTEKSESVNTQKIDALQKEIEVQMVEFSKKLKDFPSSVFPNQLLTDIKSLKEMIGNDPLEKFFRSVLHLENDLPLLRVAESLIHIHRNELNTLCCAFRGKYWKEKLDKINLEKKQAAGKEYESIGVDMRKIREDRLSFLAYSYNFKPLQSVEECHESAKILTGLLNYLEQNKPLLSKPCFNELQEKIQSALDITHHAWQEYVLNTTQSAIEASQFESLCEAIKKGLKSKALLEASTLPNLSCEIQNTHHQFIMFLAYSPGTEMVWVARLKNKLDLNSLFTNRFLNQSQQDKVNALIKTIDQINEIIRRPRESIDYQQDQFQEVDKVLEEAQVQAEALEDSLAEAFKSLPLFSTRVKFKWPPKLEAPLEVTPEPPTVPLVVEEKTQEKKDSATHHSNLSQNGVVAKVLSSDSEDQERSKTQKLETQEPLRMPAIEAFTPKPELQSEPAINTPENPSKFLRFSIDKSGSIDAYSIAEEKEQNSKDIFIDISNLSQSKMFDEILFKMAIKNKISSQVLLQLAIQFGEPMLRYLWDSNIDTFVEHRYKLLQEENLKEIAAHHISLGECLLRIMSKENKYKIDKRSRLMQLNPYFTEFALKTPGINHGFDQWHDLSDERNVSIILENFTKIRVWWRLLKISAFVEKITRDQLHALALTSEHNARAIFGSRYSEQPNTQLLNKWFTPENLNEFSKKSYWSKVWDELCKRDSNRPPQLIKIMAQSDIFTAFVLEQSDLKFSLNDQEWIELIASHRGPIGALIAKHPIPHSCIQKTLESRWSFSGIPQECLYPLAESNADFAKLIIDRRVLTRAQCLSLALANIQVALHLFDHSNILDNLSSSEEFFQFLFHSTEMAAMALENFDFEEWWLEYHTHTISENLPLFELILEQKITSHAFIIKVINENPTQLIPLLFQKETLFQKISTAAWITIQSHNPSFRDQILNHPELHQAIVDQIIHCRTHYYEARLGEIKGLMWEWPSEYTQVLEENAFQGDVIYRLIKCDEGKKESVLEVIKSPEIHQKLLQTLRELDTLQLTHDVLSIPGLLSLVLTDPTCTGKLLEVLEAIQYNQEAIARIDAPFSEVIQRGPSELLKWEAFLKKHKVALALVNESLAKIILNHQAMPPFSAEELIQIATTHPECVPLILQEKARGNLIHQFVSKRDIVRFVKQHPAQAALVTGQPASQILLQKACAQYLAIQWVELAKCNATLAEFVFTQAPKSMQGSQWVEVVVAQPSIAIAILKQQGSPEFSLLNLEQQVEIALQHPAAAEYLIKTSKALTGYYLIQILQAHSDKDNLSPLLDLEVVQATLSQYLAQMERKDLSRLATLFPSLKHIMKGLPECERLLSEEEWEHILAHQLSYAPPKKDTNLLLNQPLEPFVEPTQEASLSLPQQNPVAFWGRTKLADFQRIIERTSFNFTLNPYNLWQYPAADKVEIKQLARLHQTFLKRESPFFQLSEKKQVPLFSTESLSQIFSPPTGYREGFLATEFEGLFYCAQRVPNALLTVSRFYSQEQSNGSLILAFAHVCDFAKKGMSQECQDAYLEEVQQFTAYIEALYKESPVCNGNSSIHHTARAAFVSIQCQLKIIEHKIQLEIKRKSAEQLLMGLRDEFKRFIPKILSAGIHLIGPETLAEHQLFHLATFESIQHDPVLIEFLKTDLGQQLKGWLTPIQALLENKAMSEHDISTLRLSEEQTGVHPIFQASDSPFWIEFREEASDWLNLLIQAATAYSAIQSALKASGEKGRQFYTEMASPFEQFTHAFYNMKKQVETRRTLLIEKGDKVSSQLQPHTDRRIRAWVQKNFSVFQASSKEGIDHLENCQKYLERVQLNRKEFYTLQGLPMPVDLNPLEIAQPPASHRTMIMPKKDSAFIYYVNETQRIIHLVWTTLNEHVFPPIFRWASEKAVPYGVKVIDQLRPHVHTAAETASERLAHEWSVLPDRIEKADVLQKETRRTSRIIFGYVNERIFSPSLRWTAENIGPYWTKIVDYIAPVVHTASDKVQKKAREEWDELSRRLHTTSEASSDDSQCSSTLSDPQGVLPMESDTAEGCVPSSATSQFSLDLESQGHETPMSDSLIQHGIFSPPTEMPPSPVEVKPASLSLESK